MKILIKKNRIFWVFGGGEGKKMMLGVWTDEFCAKTVQTHNVS